MNYYNKKNIMGKMAIIILTIYLIGYMILFVFLLQDIIKCGTIIKRRDIAKIIICSSASWVYIIIISLSYLLSYCEDWLNEPLFKNNKNK